MVKEAKAEHSSSAGNWGDFYSEFITEDNEFSIEKLYEDFKQLQLKESVHPFAATDDKQREKDHKRWLYLKGIFEKLSEVHQEKIKNPTTTLSSDGLDDLPPHYSNALGIFNSLEKFLEIDITILHEVKPENETEELNEDEVQANLKARTKVLANLEAQMKFFQSFTAKDYMKKIDYIIRCADTIYKAPSPKNIDEDHKIKPTDFLYSAQRIKPLVDPGDAQRLATTDDVIRSIKTKTLGVILKYKANISKYNYYGHRRAHELELKISGATTVTQLTDILGTFFKHGKTEIDRQCLSFFRSPSRSSGTGRQSLRGMLMDKLIPTAIHANCEDWLRATRAREFLKESLSSIQSYVRRVLSARKVDRSIYSVTTIKHDSKQESLLSKNKSR
jgi:hypothetical protein